MKTVNNHSIQRTPFLKDIKKWGSITCLLFLFKMLLSLASINELQWFLSPIVFLVELFTAIDFIWTPDIGFTSNLNIVIEKSCAGGNFFIICMILLVIKNWNPFTIQSKIAQLSFIILMSYIITILANSMRIISAIKLVSFRQLTDYIDPKSAHLVLGGIIYILILLSLNHIISKKHEQA